MKHPLFAQQWQKLQTHSRFYWQLLETLPLQELQQPLQAGKWSRLQVMEHLCGAEGAILQYLQRKQYAIISSRSSMPGFLRSFLLNAALRSPLKFKAPAVEGLEPTNATPPQELLSRWQQIRQAWSEYLDQVPDTAAGQPMFRHPRAGALTLSQTLQFMREHLDHHRRQLV